MTTRTATRLTVKTEHGQRVILGVSVRRNGDLILTLYPAEFLRDSGTLRSQNGLSTREQRYSVHQSMESKDGVNVIKQTLVLSDDREIAGNMPPHYTKAIKAKNRFAHVFSRRSSNLQSSTYDLTKVDVSYIELAAFQTTAGTLCFSVFVADKDLKFRKRSMFCNIFQEVFGEFSVLVLTSFLPMPSHHTGHFMHSTTLDPGKAPEPVKGALEDLMLGLTPDGCLNRHKLMCHLSTEEMISTIGHQLPLKPADIALVRRVGPSKTTNFRPRHSKID